MIETNHVYDKMGWKKRLYPAQKPIFEYKNKDDELLIILYLFWYHYSFI